MIHKIYSIYDSKAQVYTLPYFQPREAQALRQFSDWCNNPEHTFGMHPEDYTLFSTGEYDDELATITQDKITSIANGLTLLQE